MKRVTFAILCLLSISCLNLLAKPGTKGKKVIKHPIHKTDENEVVFIHKGMEVDSFYQNLKKDEHIRIYCSNGEIVEPGKVKDGNFDWGHKLYSHHYFDSCYLHHDDYVRRYYCDYLTPVESDFKRPFYSTQGAWQTDKLLFTTWLQKKEAPYEKKYYKGDVTSLQNTLLGKVHIMDWNLIYREKKTFDPDEEIWSESKGWIPLYSNESVDSDPQWGFSVNPKSIKKIEFWYE